MTSDLAVFSQRSQQMRSAFGHSRFQDKRNFLLRPSRPPGCQLKASKLIERIAVPDNVGGLLAVWQAVRPEGRCWTGGVIHVALAELAIRCQRAIQVVIVAALRLLEDYGHLLLGPACSSSSPFKAQKLLISAAVQQDPLCLRAVCVNFHNK